MRKFLPSAVDLFQPPARTRRQVIVVGAGHNGLVAAAYLAKRGIDVLLLERRHVVGGAAVTEELFPGFRYSRASYLAGLLRPCVIQELQLEKYGFKYLPRDTSSFTLCDPAGPHAGKFLRFCSDSQQTLASIAQFSQRDAARFQEYEAVLAGIRELLPPLLDSPLPDFSGSRLRAMSDLARLASSLWPQRAQLLPLYDLMMSSAQRVLDKYFESDVLKATLALDAVIGNSAGISAAGSGYALLHLVMGESLGRPGVWSYHQGGMGALSEAIRRSAVAHGAEVCTNAECVRIVLDTATGRAAGVDVRTSTGTLRLHADTVISNATPFHTFTELLHEQAGRLPAEFMSDIRAVDYGGGAMKINCAVDRLPNFSVWPNSSFGPAGTGADTPGPPHQGTVHFEDSMEILHKAAAQAEQGFPADRPVIEMVVPSAVDPTLAPPGKHVVQFFIQYMPYRLHASLGGGGPGGGWEHAHGLRERCADVVFQLVEQHCPGFIKSVLHRDILSPRDLELVFGLHEGNIYHGGLGLAQIGFLRPAKGYASHRTPVPGLYLCSAGCHPGGGVMGAAGRNCSIIVGRDLGLS
eukprot:g59330.t1